MAMIFSADGNIGSGKSRLLTELKEQFKYHREIIFIQEPVKEWEMFTDKEGKPILVKFYENPEKWAFAFQMMAYISRLSQLKKCIKENPTGIFITERCTYTDFHVFAKMLYHSGKINKIEYTIYIAWFDEFMEDVPIKGFIYIKTRAQKCLERIKKRAREGEVSGIDIEYLQKCHQYHENWLMNEAKVLVLDGNIDYSDDNQLFNRWAKDIDTFISSFVPSFVPPQTFCTTAFPEIPLY